MYNAIRLLKGEASLTKRKWNKFTKGDTIWGADRESKEVKRWSMGEEEEAKEELKKYKCSYDEWQDGVDIEEYALECCELDEDGEYVSGSDFYLAEEYKDKEKDIIVSELEKYKEIKGTGVKNVTLAESILKNAIVYFAKKENSSFKDEIREDLYNVALDYFIGF